MTSNRPRTRRSLAGLASSLILLTACGGSDDPASVSATVDSVTTTTTEPVPDAPESTLVAAATAATTPAPADADPAPATTLPASTAPASTAPAATVPIVTEPAGGTLPDCLIGDWIVNDEEMNAYYMALAQNSGAGLEITADGNMLISMTATDYVFTADYTVNIAVSGQTGTGVATGTARGTWTVEDEVIQSSLTDSDLNIEVTVGGVSFDGSDLGNSLLQSDPFANTPASCDGPTLLFQSGPTEDIRHPVVLTPA